MAISLKDSLGALKRIQIVPSIFRVAFQQIPPIRRRLYLKACERAVYDHATENPLSGLWKPTCIEKLYYGPHCVQNDLLSCLPGDNSKALIITGSSLARRTTLVSQVEIFLGQKWADTQWAGTFSSIKEHAPIACIDQAVDTVFKDTSIDTLISIGGGSAIDSAKIISHRNYERHGSHLHHIAIPTTLSAAECTMGAAYTTEEGLKAFVIHPELAPKAIFYDAIFARETPSRLWLSSGLTALSHAVELMYYPTASEIPCKQMCLRAASDLMTYLQEYNHGSRDINVMTRLQLAAFASLGFVRRNFEPLGLSNALEYALGSPYGIPHGETSCLTLGHAIQLKARVDPTAAQSISRLRDYIGQKPTGDNLIDATMFGNLLLGFVRSLGLSKNLGEYGVGEDQVEIITERATRGINSKKPSYKAVRSLVQGLY
ncbi:MAG: hypothetical protein M1820_002142 [Bogoriella megaspora]|nr:MAG: hypothetical protein M1820_002142 [Bogoriella megaspora]